MKKYQMVLGLQWSRLLQGLAFLFLVFVYCTGSAEARSCRVDLIPNGEVNRCSNCHVNPRGGGRRNSFGRDVEDALNRGNCSEFWVAELAALDSDGDGRTNGEELLDPRGLWAEDDPQPGDESRVTHPGEEDDPPPPKPNPYVRGDSNSSGSVDLSDGVFTLSFLFRSDRAPGCMAAADSNGDGALDISDAVFVFLYLFAGGSPPGNPFPECGISADVAEEDCEAAGACG